MRPFYLLIGVVVASSTIIAASKRTGGLEQGPPRKAQAAASRSEVLPKDVSPDSGNRLPLIQREDLDERGKKAYDAARSDSYSGASTLRGAAEIRLHGTGTDVRWASPVGRQITELAILTTARERDQPYEWSLHEMEAIAVGVNPAVINAVRDRKTLGGLGEKETVTIKVGREIFGKHKLSAATYAEALAVFGAANLVDVIDLMGQYAATATRLTAFNQQMPPQMKQFLPLPFVLPNDIHADSRSRLPLARSQPQNPQNPESLPTLYSRSIEPVGTGPQQLARHGAGLKSLEASQGRKLTGLAALATAREYDEEYDWTLTELAARQDGLDSAVIGVVRERKSPGALGEKEAALIEFSRELLGKHNVSAQIYAHALSVFGETDLVDFVTFIAQHSRDDVLLIGFDQHLPAGQKPLLGDR